MNKSIREARNSPVKQGKRERAAYTFDFSDLGTPTEPNAILYAPGEQDVSSSHLYGTCVINGNEITSPFVISLDAEKYILLVEAWVNGNLLGKFIRIEGEFP